MIFYITKASDYDYKEEKEINTVEEIVELSKSYTGNGIIICGNQIEIYDDYIE